MKKIVLLVLICVMLAGGAGSAFAEEASADTDIAAVASIDAGVRAKLGTLKEFRDELHSINGLRAERLDWKKQIVDKQDQLLDLTAAARDNGDKDALKEAAQIRKQITTLNKETLLLAKQAKAEFAAFRQAIKDEDSTAAQSSINKVIETLAKINETLKQKTYLYNQMIIALK